MKTEILKDIKFEEQYNNTVKPFREKYEKSAYYEAEKGKALHYLSYKNDGADKTIILLHGFTECAEKFTELAYYFFNEGYSVYIPEMRGHGLSYKDKAPKYGVAIDSFDTYSKDFTAFLKDVVKEENPVYVWSHSLGGNIALLSLIDNPDLPIKKLVLSSPMICGNMGMPVGIAKLVASLMIKIGKGNAPAPGKCEFHPEKGNPDASSKERGDFALKQKTENEEYQTCGPVFEWVLRSIEARDKILKDENIKKIKTPMLLIKPEKDAQLLEKPQDEFASKANDIIVKNTKGTCHEIFQSISPELQSYMDMILEFLK